MLQVVLLLLKNTFFCLQRSDLNLVLKGSCLLRRGKEVLWDFKLGDLYIFVHLPTPYNRLQHRDFFGYEAASTCQAFELWSDVSPHPGSNAAMSIWCFTRNRSSKVSADLPNSGATTRWWRNLTLCFWAKVDQCLLKVLGTVFICAMQVLCEMPCSHVSAFVSMCILPPFIPTSQFHLTLDPKLLSVTNAFCICRLLLLHLGSGFFLCVCVGCFGFVFCLGFFCGVFLWFGLVLFCFAGVTILIICMKFLFSPSALSVCGTDSSREVNECYCISEEELFHAITLKVHERTEWKEWGREREHERE